jgi:hypothetical protein
VSERPDAADGESFEAFLSRSTRYAPLIGAGLAAFITLRAFGLRAGPILLITLAIPTLPLSMLHPELGLHALVLNFVNEFDAYYHLQEYFPFSLPALLDIAVVIGIYHRFGRARRLPRLRSATTVLLLLYVGWVTLSVLLSDVTVPGLWERFRTGFLIRPVLFLFLIVIVQRPEQLHRLLLVLFVALTMLMAGGLSDFIQKGGSAYRVRGTLGAINYLSYVCIVTLPILISVSLYLRERRTKALLFALSLATLFVGLQTLSRSGYYSLIITLGFLAFRFTRQPAALMATLVFAGVFYFLVPSELGQRLEEVQSIEQTDRYHLSQLGYRMAAANPLLGVGWHAYEAKFLEYDAEGIFRRPQGPHSLYFAIAASCGFPALAMYLAMYGMTFARSFVIQRRYRRMRDSRSLGYYLAVGIEGGLLGHFVFGLAGSYGDSYYAYLLLALAVIVIRFHQEHPPPAALA